MQNIKRIGGYRWCGSFGSCVGLFACWANRLQAAITHGLENLTNEQTSAEPGHGHDRGRYLSLSHVSARFTVLDERVRQQLISEGLPTQWIVDSDIQHQLFRLVGAIMRAQNTPNYH
ncbi:hypothetical protein ACT691_16415 [Vibrio metschnikovii]